MASIEAESAKQYIDRYWVESYVGTDDELVDDKLVADDLVFTVRNVNPRAVVGLALADANDIRRALAIGEGKLERLPVAQLGNSSDCVLARALSNGWRADVSTGHTHLTHPASEDLGLEGVELAVKTLKQLGFLGVRYWNGAREYNIDIPHTWAMAEFVTWYDKGAFPELVLADDVDGQEIIEKYKKKVAAGMDLQSIYSGESL